MPLKPNKETCELIDEVIAYLSVPGNEVFYNQDNFGKISSVNSCETECCIAGVIDYLKSDKKSHIIRAKLAGGNSISEIAASYFHNIYGYVMNMSNLFGIGRIWIKPFGKRFVKAAGNKLKEVEVAIARLKHFKKTGE